jgi:hypothetical protein
MTYTADDFKPGSWERENAANASAGACVNIEDVVTDWGNFDEDVTEKEATLSWEHTDVDSPFELTFDAADKLNETFYGAKKDTI